MINLAWGGFTNGSVPVSATTQVDSAGHRLEHVAAAKWLAMRQACFDATGKWINVAPGADSANRTVAQQEIDWAWYQADTKNHAAAAYPGTSNHGWARAVDITGYETATSGWQGGTYVNTGVVWKWLMANIGRFGFSWDTGRASHESWHFESYNPPSATAVAGGGAVPIDNLPTIALESEMNMVGVPGGTVALLTPISGQTYTDPKSFEFIAALGAYGPIDTTYVGPDGASHPFTEDQISNLVSVANARGAALAALTASKVAAPDFSGVLAAIQKIAAPPAIDPTPIIAAVKAAIAGLSLPGAAPTAAQIATAVDQVLADNFAAIPKAVNDDEARRLAQ